MDINRRQLLIGGVAAGLGALIPRAHADSESRIKVVAFDGFPIFDPRPIFAEVEKAFPGKGAEISNVWRSRQFEYTWLRSLSGSYKDFWKVTEDALLFATRSLNLELTTSVREEVMSAYLRLKPWADVQAGLDHLKSAGVKLAFLSNFTQPMLEANIKNSGLDGMFDQLLSTDRVRAFKPSPQAYKMALESFHVRKDEVMFVAYAGWDAAGAKAFGFPTYWANRSHAPLEELGFAPDQTSPDLSGLVSFVKSF